MRLSDDLIQELILDTTEEINQLIKDHGYENLRVSILAQQGESMIPWQVRIDYDPANNDYPVYVVDDTAKLPNIVPHYDYPIYAKRQFLRLLDDMVARNQQLVSEDKEPLYHSLLWDKK